MTRRLAITLAVASLAAPALAGWNWWADALKGQQTAAAGAAATPGNAVLLDGSTKYFELTQAGSTFLHATNCTIAVWIWPAGAGKTIAAGRPDYYSEGIFSDDGGQGYWKLGRGNESGFGDRVLWTWYDGTFGAMRLPYTSNAWNLIVFTADGATWRLDNVTAGTTTNRAGYSSLNLANTCEIGRGYNSSIGHWNGKLDQLAIWKRPLTAAERSDLYNSGAGLKVTTTGTFPSTGVLLTNSMTACWLFDESGSATNAVDLKNGYNGIGINIQSTNWVTGIVPQ